MVPPRVVAVAYSGGLDSTVLLHAAVQALKNKAAVVALHVNHRINPAADDWEEHARQTAQALAIDCDVARLTDLSAGDPNLEERAREARWKALVRMAVKHNAQAILTAHHANDQAETVLLQLLRGTGLAGMGMRTQSAREGIAILRPFLPFERSTLEEFARARDLQWIEDPSNSDVALRRNAVRHALWPAVEAADSRALSSLLRFAEHAQHLDESMDWLATRWLHSCLDSNDTHHLHWGRLMEAPLPVRQLGFRAWIKRLGLRMPTQARLDAMLTQLDGKTAAGVRCTHEGWTFSKRGSMAIATPPLVGKGKADDAEKWIF
ncbi:MAG: tRNA lysidine(34) synthetase TilS [Burkholderiaceae bacterium]